MTDEFIQKRITEFRMKKGVSEYQMSLDLGQNRCYIQGISNGRMLPSMHKFMEICEYLDVMPEAFFHVGKNELMSEILSQLCEEVRKLSRDQIKLLIEIARNMKKD